MKGHFLRTKRGLAVIVNAIFVISMYGCTTATSYVKPTHEELIAIRNLALTVEGNPEFSHIGEITKETFNFVLPFFFGLAGAYAASHADTSTRKDMDAKSAAAIKPKDSSSIALPVFIGALVETLQQSKRFDDVRVIDNIGEKARNIWDAVVVVKIVNWGSRIKQAQSDVVIPFMDIHLSVIRQHDNKLLLNETQTVTYDTNHTLDDYKQQEGLFGRDFMSLNNKAGKQVAMLLLDF
jgi:hypothetical protein